jgi:ethanolamine ammonia-lyase small subunit
MSNERNKPAVTTARIGLGEAGAAIPTREHLRFQLDHALARDAVHTPLDEATLLRELQRRGLASLLLRSAVTAEPAGDQRRTYLQRPDLGRTLHRDSQQLLRECAAATTVPPEIVFILADGLSALAIERHALPLLDATLGLLAAEPSTVGPICVVTQARVAVGDSVGSLLGARCTVVLIGERPGLSSPDSLGVYITWQPALGRTDAERNCISNVRVGGLSYAAAAGRLVHILREAFRLETSGIALKDDLPAVALDSE